MDESARIVCRCFQTCRPVRGLILGSGGEAALGAFDVEKSIPYARLPIMGAESVAGHAGVLHWAEHAGLETLIFQGRHHWYEGLGWEPVAFPIFLLKKLGATVVVLTNSAGGIRSDLSTGTFMALTDHINGMGINPLQGKHDKFWGERFVDQTGVYDPGLLATLKQAARKAGVPLKQGIYMAVTGPVYETPAEIAAFKKLGAAAVGMSTVPEAILANAAGLKVVAISFIANAAAGIGGKEKISHDAVRQAGRDAGRKIERLIREFWEAMAKYER
jgi:inosine/guanosine/xanthosine phosphorylase family protein